MCVDSMDNACPCVNSMDGACGMDLMDYACSMNSIVDACTIDYACSMHAAYITSQGFTRGAGNMDSFDYAFLTYLYPLVSA